MSGPLEFYAAIAASAAARNKERNEPEPIDPFLAGVVVAGFVVATLVVIGAWTVFNWIGQ